MKEGASPSKLAALGRIHYAELVRKTTIASCTTALQQCKIINRLSQLSCQFQFAYSQFPPGILVFVARPAEHSKALVLGKALQTSLFHQGLFLFSQTFTTNLEPMSDREAMKAQHRSSSVCSRQRRPVSTLLFDLDDTLYRNEAIAGLVKTRIMEYMETKLTVPKEQVAALCAELYASHGTTVAGLAAKGYEIDMDVWHEFVHYGAIDYQHMLRPDPELRELLNSIPLPKYIFTNADERHAELCLARLGIQDCFQGVFHFENVQQLGRDKGALTAGSTAILCKPQRESFEVLLQHIGVTPEEVVFFDDSIRNLATAHSLGIQTVWVGKEKVEEGAHVAVPTCHALRVAMPELFVRRSLNLREEEVREAMEHGVEIEVVAS